MALEVMVPNPAIRNLIREDKIHQIYSQQQIGQEKYHMQTLNQSLAELYLNKTITYEDALNKSQDTDELKRIITPSGSGSTAGRSERKVLGG
jgi:twitching motility protein PilT